MTPAATPAIDRFALTATLSALASAWMSCARIVPLLVRTSLPPPPSMPTAVALACALASAIAPLAETPAFMVAVMLTDTLAALASESTFCSRMLPVFCRSSLPVPPWMPCASEVAWALVSARDTPAATPLFVPEIETAMPAASAFEFTFCAVMLCRLMMLSLSAPPTMPVALAIACASALASAPATLTPSAVPDNAIDTLIALASASARASRVPELVIESSPSPPSIPVLVAVATDSERASATSATRPCFAKPMLTAALTLLTSASDVARIEPELSTVSLSAPPWIPVAVALPRPEVSVAARFSAPPLPRTVPATVMDTLTVLASASAFAVTLPSLISASTPVPPSMPIAVASVCVTLRAPVALPLNRFSPSLNSTFMVAATAMEPPAAWAVAETALLL